MALILFSGCVRPVNVVQALGLNATFLCQHPTDNGTLEWIINGTIVRGVSNNAMIRIEGRGNSTEALIIRALSQFNKTEVVCVLFIVELNGSIVVDRSTPATLTLQGKFYISGLDTKFCFEIH